MGITSRRLFAPTVPAFRDGLSRVTKSVTTEANTTPPAVLTYPVRDLQGDVLDPSGLDLSEFNDTYERLSNFEHGAYIGTTQVEFKSLPVLNAERQPDERLGLISLPVGVTTFFESAADAKRHTLRRFDGNGRVVGVYSPDECARLADQVRPLVPGVFGGVSLEFRPDGPEGTAYKSLGKSPMLDRDAYHFTRTKMIGLASACDLPVNPVAGYAAASPETIARAEKALRLCEKPGTLDVIRKSLRPLTQLLQPPSGRVTAPVRREPTMSTKTAPRRLAKAEMYDDEPMDATGPAEVEMETEVEAPMGDDMKPTPAALFQFAQALKDACMMADDMAARGEHMQGVKALKKFCEQVEGIADKVTAMAEKVAGAVAGEEVEIDVDADMEADAPPMEMDDDGGLMSKSLSAQKWRPLRFVKATPYTLKHLKAKQKQNTPDLEKQLAWALDRIEELEAKRA